MQLVNSNWEPVTDSYSGHTFHVLYDLHSTFDTDELDKVLMWLKYNNINYHIFGDDLVLYKPKEATLFVLIWSK